MRRYHRAAIASPGTLSMNCSVHGFLVFLHFRRCVSVIIYGYVLQRAQGVEHVSLGFP